LAKYFPCSVEDDVIVSKRRPEASTMIRKIKDVVERKTLGKGIRNRE
jgi:hypothetical protein